MPPPPDWLNAGRRVVGQACDITMAPSIRLRDRLPTATAASTS